MPKVSVIVPIFGVEQHIEHCAESLFSQTIDSIEYIFIDDCSPDKSIEILKGVLSRFPSRKEQVKIIHNQKNLKQAASRSVGLHAATGDYIIHCDPDDWVESNMYESLYSRAIHTDADIVTCDFFKEWTKGSEIFHIPQISSPHDCITEATMKSHWSLWNRMVRRSLIQDRGIDFLQGVNMWEDLCFMVQCYYFANKIEYVSKPLYHYNLSNLQSITNVVDDSKLDQQKKCIAFLESFFLDKKEDFTGFIQMYKHFLSIAAIYSKNQPILINLRKGGRFKKILYLLINLPRKIKTLLLLRSVK